MTTDQEAENVAASVRHLPTQRGIDAREWERQAKQWESVAIAQRKELDGLRKEKQVLCNMLDPDATGQTLVEAIRAIIAERDVAHAALQTIRDSYGKVCQDFDLCTHPACQSSYGAWAVASAALTGAAGEG